MVDEVTLVQDEASGFIENTENFYDAVSSISDKTYRLHIIEERIRKNSIMANYHEWSAFILMDKVRKDKLYTASGYETLEDWLKDLSLQLRRSVRSIKQRISAVRVGLEGLNLTQTDIIDTPPTTMYMLLERIDYDPRSGVIKDDDDPTKDPTKWGVQQAREQYDRIHAMAPGDARLEINEVTGRQSLQWIISVLPETYDRAEDTIVIGSVSARLPDDRLVFCGTQDDFSPNIPLYALRDLCYKLGVDYTRLMKGIDVR